MVLFALVMAGIMITERRSSRMMAEAEGGPPGRLDAVQDGPPNSPGRSSNCRVNATGCLAAAKESAAIEEYVPRSFLIYLVMRSLPKGTSLLSLEIGTRVVRPQPGMRRKKITLGGKDATEEAPPPGDVHPRPGRGRDGLAGHAGAGFAAE